MTERSSDPGNSSMPEDIATLYSRAQLQGTRYWDFSASRKEVRGQLRHRTAREQIEQAPPIPFQAPQVEPKMVHAPEIGSREERREEPQPRPHSIPKRRQKPGPQRNSESSPRWYALNSVFTPAQEASAPPPRVSFDHLPPTVAVLSLAGGVGKTCMVATLGRALSSMGEHVLLADTATCGMLPFYFGSREFKPGVVRTFSSPEVPSPDDCDVPVHVLNLDVERYPGDGGELDPLLNELVRGGRSVSRILLDVATASRDAIRRLLLLRPIVLVPVLPDMSSVASLASLEAFLGRDGQSSQVFYLLNQFDASLPLHLDVQAALQQQLGNRLLPFVLSRNSAVSEALAEGMTVIDYAPGSSAAEDFWNLADWLRRLAAPATVGYGGVRWSER
jgi:cellulose synthase operon protein YhjQ